MLRLVSLFLLVAATSTVAVPAQAQDRPLLLGMSLAQTGQLGDIGQAYRRGLYQWLDELNARGGVFGRRIEFRVRDDKSDATLVGGLYEKLLDEDKVDLLVGPAGSAATVSAMGVAEARRRVIVNGSGADNAVLKRGNRWAFHVPAALQDHGDHVWPLVRAVGAKKPLLVDRDDTGVGKRLREQADLAGLAVEREAGTSEPAAVVARARAAGVDALVVSASGSGAGEFVKAMKKVGYAPRVFIATGAAQPAFVRAIGQDAEYVIGVLPYSAAQGTPGNAGFVKAFREKYQVLPDFYAACGYAAGKLVEAGLREAGTLDQDKLRDAFARVKIDSPLGAHEAGKDNMQMGARPVLFQFQLGRRQVVWPESAATANLVVPYPEWAGRKLLTK